MKKSNFILLISFLFCIPFLKAQPFSQEQVLDHLKLLSSDRYEGRASGTEGSTLARTQILQVFETLGLEKVNGEYEQAFRFYNRKFRKEGAGINLVGLIKGSRYPDKYIVVSAHYDHLGIRKDAIYNGADDNASGTCALFAIAAHFKANPPLHSILIVAFDAEEQGLQGAKHFVDEPPVPLNSIVLNINMDMIGRNVNNEIYICGTYYYPQLKKIVKKPAKKSDLKVSFGHDNPKSKRRDDWTNSSDHGPFHEKSIPFLYFGEEDHPDYHRPTDTFEGIMPQFYWNAVQLVTNCTARLDQKLN